MKSVTLYLAGAGGANLKAGQDSWPLAVQFFAKNLK
jgi:hypothetical protein